MIGINVLISPIKNIEYEISESTIYSEKEINEAVKLVEKLFYQYSNDCTLKKIIYNENYSQAMVTANFDEYDPAWEGIIYLTTVYDLESVASNGDLVPAMENNSADWILFRSDDEWWYSGDPNNIYNPGLNKYKR